MQASLQGCNKKQKNKKIKNTTMQLHIWGQAYYVNHTFIAEQFEPSCSANNAIV